MFVSRTVLYTVAVSLASKLLLLLFLILFFRWVTRSDLSPAQKTALCAAGGAALALLFVNTEYLAFLNSFYFESASYIFLFAFMAALVVLWRRGPSRLTNALCLAALLLLAISRPGAVYWLAFGLLFVFGLRPLLTSRRHTLAYLALVVILSPLVFLFTKYPQPNYESGPAYHQMFLGVLTYSRNPSQRLRELGMSGGEACIGVTPYTAPGDQCLATYRSKLTLGNALSVIAREPAILARMTEDVADQMQLPTVQGLVRRAIDAPAHHAAHCLRPLVAPQGGAIPPRAGAVACAGVLHGHLPVHAAPQWHAARARYDRADDHPGCAHRAVHRHHRRRPARLAQAPSSSPTSCLTWRRWRCWGWR